MGLEQLTKKYDIADMEIGDYIECEYTASSRQVGIFNNLGKATKDYIPVTGSDAPDGKFNFIKVDKTILIADRVIQHSINWDTLNRFNMVEGCSINYGIYNGISSYTEIPYNSKLAPNRITIYARVYLPSLTVYDERIVSKAQTGGYVLYLRGTDNKLCFSVYANGGYRIAEVPMATIGIGWHDIVGTFDGYYSKLFVDGVLQSTRSLNGTYDIYYTWDNSLLIGADAYRTTGPDPAAPGFFTGAISDISIWNVGKSDTDAVKINRNSIALSDPSLVLFLNSDTIDYSTNSWKDIKNGINATLHDVEVLYKDRNGLIRMPTGGVAYLDSNGNLSTTDQGLGAYPSINEWDKYIVNSDLNGKIVAGDDNVWHWRHPLPYTMCKDTPVLGLETINGIISNSDRRIQRGRVSYVQFLTQAHSSTGLDIMGFRPVLQLKHDKQTNLWY